MCVRVRACTYHYYVTHIGHIDLIRKTAGFSWAAYDSATWTIRTLGCGSFLKESECGWRERDVALVEWAQNEVDAG
jgi:hypothetical protein